MGRIFLKRIVEAFAGATCAFGLFWIDAVVLDGLDARPPNPTMGIINFLLVGGLGIMVATFIGAFIEVKGCRLQIRPVLLVSVLAAVCFSIAVLVNLWCASLRLASLAQANPIAQAVGFIGVAMEASLVSVGFIVLGGAASGVLGGYVASRPDRPRPAHPATATG